VFQAGFIKGRRTTDIVFVIKTTVDKYLTFNLGRLFWCFVDFGKAFDSVHTEALLYKLRRHGISDDTAKCIKELYDGFNFCVKC
jgi:hypothetical protein